MITEVLVKKVLVVDDDPGIRETLSRTLTQVGYEVCTAGSAEEGMQLVRYGHEFQAIISNIHLPGMDGKTLVNRILSRRPSVKAVLTTAFGGVREYLETTRSGAVEYMIKPINPSQLLCILDHMIGRPEEMPSDYWVN